VAVAFFRDLLIAIYTLIVVAEVHVPENVLWV
jgi:hypothetical protein